MNSPLKNVLPAVIIALAILAGFSFKSANKANSQAASYEYKQFSTISIMVMICIKIIQTKKYNKV